MRMPETPAVKGGFSRARCTGCVVLGMIGAVAISIGGCKTADPHGETVCFPSPPAAARVVYLRSFGDVPTSGKGRSGFGRHLRSFGGAGRMEAPMGMAYCDGHLLICDTALGVVHAFDLGAGRARRMGDSGEDRLRTPVAVACVPGGDIYVADTGRAQVVAFDSAGTVRRTYAPTDASSFRPVAVATDGDRLFVANAARGTIDVFSISDGGLAITWPLAKDKLGAVPLGLAVAQGELFVADGLGGRVIVLDGDGKVVSTISQRGDRYGDLGQPRQVAVGPDGVLLIADAEFGYVHLFDRSGQLLMMVGAAGTVPDGTFIPVGVAVAETVADGLARLVPADFAARYYFFVSTRMDGQVGLYAVGQSVASPPSPTAR